MSPSTIRKRQCQTLLILVGFGMKQMSATELAKSPSEDLEFIISSLMEVATLDSSEQVSDLRAVGSSAQWALLQSIAVISAQFFVSTILAMLSSENCKVGRFRWVAAFNALLRTHQICQIYQAAFALLASRVPEMRAETREEISSIMAQIVTQMSVVMPSLQHAEIISEAISALLSIGESASSKDRKSTRLNSSHSGESRMPSSA